MEHTAPAILEIGAVLLVAAGAGWLARFAGVPAVVGYLAVGVVIVNITRSRRRTTDPATDHALLGWSVLQDVTGVALAAVVLALGGGSDRSPVVAIAGLVAFAVLAGAVAWALPRVLVALRDQ